MSILESEFSRVRTAPRAVGARDDRGLRRLRAVVLLSGTVGTAGIAGAAQRPALTLPVDANRRLLDCWMEQLQSLTSLQESHGLPVRVLTNLPATAMGAMPADNGVHVRVETDPAELRGTAGLLRDAAEAYDDDAYILVANAAQLLARPLIEALAELAETGADVAFFADEAGHPGTLMLIRCGCLRGVAKLGFVDLKEQALPAIARHHRVRVVESGRPTSLPIRTLAEYVRALRRHHTSAGSLPHEALDEGWNPVFAIRERGAELHPTAQVHDSVVLSGATVGRGAVLVRSVVCAGASVPARATVVDRVLAARVG